MSNAIYIIKPYWLYDTWVFDDAEKGLAKEPFVAGAPEILTEMSKHIPNALKGFRLLFSDSPFPNYQTKFTWRREEGEGNWYYSENYKAEGWLCKALYCYYRIAPQILYAKAEK